MEFWYLRAMAAPSEDEAPRLVEEFRQGNDQALSRLVPLVYKELRRLANAYILLSALQERDIAPRARSVSLRESFSIRRSSIFNLL